MSFIIVTGMSGAGKSLALKYLEDIGFFCVDNLPPAFIGKFAELYYQAETSTSKIALGVDIRGGKLFSELIPALAMMRGKGYNYDVLFLDADDATLLKRYKESRRSHPLSRNDTMKGIVEERGLLEEVKQISTYIIDTTHLLTRDLKEKINSVYLLDKEFDSLVITVLSFGFKFGIPEDSDLVFDVRFLPNPFYVSELKQKTGEDEEVKDFVFNNPVTPVFVEKLKDMLDFLIPNYINEGKNRLVISIGCTGGRHRSVALANTVCTHLLENGRSVIVKHRDITC